MTVLFSTVQIWTLACCIIRTEQITTVIRNTSTTATVTTLPPPVTVTTTTQLTPIPPPPIGEAPTEYMVKSNISPFDFLRMQFDTDDMDQASQMVAIMEWFCHRSCDSQSPFHYRLESGLCALCYCDSLCYSYGDCCPGKYIQENRTRTSILVTDCVSHNYKSTRTPFYYMVTSCPHPVVSDHVTVGCLSSNKSLMVTAIPVTDQVSGITYKNKYCAECNAVSNYTLWQMHLSCRNYSYFTSADSFLHMYQVAMGTYNCHVILKSGIRIEARRCSVSTGVVDRCNVTGEWTYYDEKVISGCSRFFYPVITRAKRYKNIFCYVCNSNKSWTDILSEKRITAILTGFPFTALLDFDDSDITGNVLPRQCESKDFFDSYNGNCRKIVCPVGKVVQEEQCISLVSDSSYFRYVICMKVTAQAPVHLTFMIPEQIEKATAEMLKDTLLPLKLSLSYEQLSPVSLKCENKTVIASYQLKIGVLAKYSDRDDLEKNLLTTFKKDRVMTAYSDGNHSVEISVFDECFKNSFSDNPEHFFCAGEFMLFHYSEMNYDYMTHYYADLVVDDMLWCPRVELNSTEYSLESSSDYIVVEATNKTLTRSEYQATDKGSVKVCLFNFRRNETETDTSLEVPATTGGLLSLICTCISLTFLALSVIVYMAIPSYRTDVSRNNITLALNLIVAQTLFEFGAEQIQLTLVCQIIGFCAHYFWLSSVFWMNACVINLFYKICFPLRSRAQSSMKIYIFLCLYSFITPGIIVTITSLSNYFVLGFSGYGRGICYLSNANSRIYGLAVPVGILVFLNILLFFITIITIYRLPKLKSTSTNKVSMIMCVNLSTITGVSWLFGFAYEATGFIGFAYAFSVFLGSVGLFLFMTFFANKLKRRLCQCSSSAVSKSSSTNKAMVSLGGDESNHINNTPSTEALTTNTDVVS